MTRKRSPQQELDDATLSIVPGRKSTKAPKQKLLDPQAPLPGAMKRVGPQPIQTRIEIDKVDPKHLRDKFPMYCKMLKESFGDPVAGLAAVFGLSEDEARQRQSTLHNEMMKAISGMSQKDLLAKMGVAKEHRLAILADMAYSGNPAASLKAVDILNDIDGSSKSSGDTWEEWIALTIKK